MAYTGGTCFRPQVHERLGISLVEVHERIGKSVISVRKNVFNKGVRNIFRGVAKFYARYEKGVPFVNRRNIKNGM